MFVSGLITVPCPLSGTNPKRLMSVSKIGETTDKDIVYYKGLPV